MLRLRREMTRATRPRRNRTARSGQKIPAMNARECDRILRGHKKTRRPRPAAGLRRSRRRSEGMESVNKCNRRPHNTQKRLLYLSPTRCLRHTLTRTRKLQKFSSHLHVALSVDEQNCQVTCKPYARNRKSGESGSTGTAENQDTVVRRTCEQKSRMNSRIITGQMTCQSLPLQRFIFRESPCKARIA